MSQIIRDVLDHNPQSWKELADVAKFVRLQYATFTDNALDIFLDTSGVFPVSQQVAAVETLEVYPKLKQEACWTYLGAKSASLENKDGDFSSPEEIFYRMRETLGAGQLIKNFIDAAHAIIATNAMDKPRKSHPIIIATRDEAGTKIFDQSLAILDILNARQERLRPQNDTIVHVVRDELGILPTRVEKTIRDVLQFKPA